jgi:hypothetical protein
MSKGNTFENDLLLLIFNNTNAANIGDATGLRGSSTVGSLFLSLHTAAYTSYARATVARTSGGFTVSGNSVTLTANVDFPAGTGGSGTATHFAVGTASSGTGKILYKGAISPTIVCGNGITPRLTTGTTITED